MLRAGSILKNLAVFILAAFVMLGLLIIVAKIPKDKIRDNALVSARYLSEGEQFGTVIENVEGSRIDRYADSILLNIAYNLDSRDSLRSVMLSAYYFTPYHEENENFLEAVKEDREPNQQYLRYWHGSIALVRPLLMFLSLKQIYILNAVILVILNLAFLIMAYKLHLRAPAVGMILASILTGCWFVPLSLEYTWVFLLLPVVSMIALRLAVKGRRDRYAVLFLLSGMVTNYLDFLTAETVTLLVPLLMVLWAEGHPVVNTQGTFLCIGKDEAKDKKRTGISGDCVIRISIRSAVAWGFGYVGMWILKWVLTAAVFKENVMPYVAEHVGERIGGDLGINIFGYLTGAITRNIGCLFPLGYGLAGAFAGVGLVIFAAYLGFVYRGKDYNGISLIAFAVIGLIPYVRFLILHNHAYLHCFFTYRAQYATVLAAVLTVAELTGWGAGNRSK